MKSVEELRVKVVDYGTFQCLSEKLAETCAEVDYYTPMEKEYRNIVDASLGYGIPKINKVGSLLSPESVKEIDLWIFPDIGFGDEQRYLRSIGKPVWGSMGADELERLRTLFIDTVEDLGLPVAPSKKIHGLDALSEYLKDKTNLWVKVNEFRDDMETWHHIDYAHSVPILRDLYVTFGGMSDNVWFVVQEDLPGATELGYDGLSVDGWFPDSSFQGYEKKNELYLGAMTEYDDLPEEVRMVNEKFSKVMEECRYRNFFAVEIRNFEGTPYFIDPTMRMPGQTGEQLLETMENLAEVIWHGANGELIQPKWNASFAASATLHSHCKTEGWKTVSVNKEVARWVKLARCCYKNGLYHFPPQKNDEVGVVLGMGDAIEETITAVKEHFDGIGDDTLSIEFEGFVELLKTVEQAEKDGIEFTREEVPSPEIVLQENT